MRATLWHQIEELQLTLRQAVICFAAILVLKQMGFIPNLAALESGKAKKCMSATAI